MYDYNEAIRNDLIDWIGDNMTMPERIEAVEENTLADTLSEEGWIDDAVTGNASGSYTFNRWRAKEYVTENMELLKATIEEFCIEAETVADRFISEDWEYFDVSIRCYVLSGAAWSLAEALSDCLEALKAEEAGTVGERIEKVLAA